ncbi:MAG: hypothetical protein KDF25_01045 [Burkholderiaceae bacterium]|nr:hypothetical protein [Burkholderiaceae bacterium]
MSHTLRSQRLGALFAAGWLLLNFPLLGLWDSDRTVFGVPLFPLALFFLWGAGIATVAWWMESRAAPDAPASPLADQALAARD